MADPLRSMARTLLQSRAATAAVELPTHTASFDQLEAEVARMLAVQDVDLDDPKVAHALMVVAGLAQGVLTAMTAQLQQREGMVHGWNVLLSSAVLAARCHAGEEGDRG